MELSKYPTESLLLLLKAMDECKDTSINYDKSIITMEIINVIAERIRLNKRKIFL